MNVRFAAVIVFAALSTSPVMSQEATRAEFDEFLKAFAGRWVGQMTWTADWPGQGKKGDKVTGYSENKLVEDGNALLTKTFAGTGSNSTVIVYDAGAKQIKELWVDSGGTVMLNIYSKLSPTKWAATTTGSQANGSKIEGKYEANITENGNVWTWTGTTIIGGKKQDDLRDVWRRVSNK